MKREKFKVIGGNDIVDVIAGRIDRYGPPTAIAHKRLMVDERAHFAMACIEKWALIAGEPDGEDSAGRTKTRRMTPVELVDHACSVTARAFAEFAQRGWSYTTPSYQQLADTVLENENHNE